MTAKLKSGKFYVEDTKDQSPENDPSKDKTVAENRAKYWKRLSEIPWKRMPQTIKKSIS